jgi:hypothetical protein
MSDNWLRANRYYIAGGTFILVSALVLVVPILGYLQGLWSETTSRLLMSGMGVLGTVLLATLTFLTLLDNRILIQERVKERKKPLQRDMMEKIVWPAIESLNDNKEKLKQEEFDWLASDYTDTDDFEFVNLNLEMIAIRGDPVTSDRFADAFPEVTDEMVQYDEYLAGLDECAFKYITKARGAILDYIETNNVTNEDGDLVNSDDALHFLLVGDRPARDDGRPDWWVEHKWEFKRIAAENAGDYYDKFHKQRTKVFNYTNQVRHSLVEVRKDIEPEYGIES